MRDISINIFLIIPQKTYVVGTSNEYPQYMFSWRNKNDIKIFGQKKNVLFRAVIVKTQIRIHTCITWSETFLFTYTVSKGSIIFQWTEKTLIRLLKCVGRSEPLQSENVSCRFSHAKPHYKV